MQDMAEVHYLNDTSADILPEKIIEGALNEEFASVVVVGWTKEGEFYHASSSMDVAEILLLLELNKKHILDQATD